MRRTLAILAATLATSATAWAAGEPEFGLVLEGHKFKPDRLEVPAGKKLKFLVENRDATPAEFESETLKVEKVIPGKGKATVFVGPLKPGEYKFFDEYNEKTATGVVVAK
jgi:plastocyanin